MRILLCLLSLAAIAAAPATDKLAATYKAAKCPMARPTPVEGKTSQPLIHPLTSESGARQEIAVLRVDVNGCIKPVVVRDNVGGRSPPVSPERPVVRSTSTPQ